MASVSVVIAAYNAEKTLERCIRSVQAQTIADLEIIIVDDVSHDGTLALARQLATRDTRVQVVAQTLNGGPGGARNAGLDAARGDWIAVVDADDEIAPERLASMIAAGDVHGADVVFDNLTYIPMRGEPSIYLPESSTVFGVLPCARYVQSHETGATDPVLGFLKPVIRRARLEQAAIRYEPRLRIGEDTLLILNLYAAGARVMIVPEASYRYYRTADSISFVFNQKNADTYVAALGQFVRDKGDRFAPPDRAALLSLLNYAEQRLKAKKLVSSLRVTNFPAVILRASRDRAVFALFRHYAIVECRSVAGRVRRKLMG